jgi:hypothetical protein
MHKKLEDFVYTKFNEGEEQKKYRLQVVFEKLNRVIAILAEQHPEIEFYKTIGDVPADIFYKQLEGHAVKHLVEDFEKQFVAPQTTH